MSNDEVENKKETYLISRRESSKSFAYGIKITFIKKKKWLAKIILNF